MKCSSGSTLAFLALTLISVSAQPTNQPGTLKWEFPTDNLVVECPALGTNGLLYVGNYNGSVYAINTTNGQQVWQVRLDRYIDGIALGDDGTVYAGAQGRGLYALDGSSGAEKCRPSGPPWGAMGRSIFPPTSSTR
jgi:outer membrane protein assembly factor BamB